MMPSTWLRSIRLESRSLAALIMGPKPGMGSYDPTCGSAGLLIKCELALEAK